MDGVDSFMQKIQKHDMNMIWPLISLFFTIVNLERT